MTTINVYYTLAPYASEYDNPEFKDGTEGPGVTHAQGEGLCGMWTLCGHVDRNDYIPNDTNNPVTCPGCRSVIAHVLENYS